MEIDIRNKLISTSNYRTYFEKHESVTTYFEKIFNEEMTKAEIVCIDIRGLFQKEVKNILKQNKEEIYKKYNELIKSFEKELTEQYNVIIAEYEENVSNKQKNMEEYNKALEVVKQAQILYSTTSQFQTA